MSHSGLLVNETFIYSIGTRLSVVSIASAYLQIYNLFTAVFYGENVTLHLAV